MIEKGSIVRLAFLFLGETGNYNDNRSERYSIATELLDNILNTIACDNSFLYNATTVKLTTTGKKNAIGEYEFNKPVDFLNEIMTLDFDKTRVVPNRMTPANWYGPTRLIARQQGERYYANKSSFALIYCRKISATETPTYLEKFLIYSLAVKLAESFSSYSDKLEMANYRMQEAEAKINALEGIQLKALEGGVVSES